ncbi:MAG: hypothetical protein RLZZ59_418, partial [Pseudomonadota bacterium]
MRLGVRLLSGAPNARTRFENMAVAKIQEWITHFGQENISDDRLSADLLGGKGAALFEMFKIGVRVPHGFNISTELCRHYYNHSRSFPDNFKDILVSAMTRLEKETGKSFGGSNPLLVSVRSGAKESMPGMMDTILNLGLNDSTVEHLAEISGNKIFALDSYRRLLQMYGEVVFSIPHSMFESIMESHDLHHDEKNLRQIIDLFKALILDESGMSFPQDVYAQLNQAIKSVLGSWTSDRANIYRELNKISHNSGTAINIQSMVFGNMGIDSATGVVFSRNPSNGQNKLYGEYLINAQGEDIVSGVRTPYDISSESGEKSMQHTMPAIYNELKQCAYKLELHYKDMQDIEFTVENGVLYILQTRSAKRATAASIKVAIDMVSESILTKKEAILRVQPESINQLLHASINYKLAPESVAKGLPASPGAATGIVVFSPYDAEELSHHRKVILVRNDTSPEDIKGMHAAAGVLTIRGGMTSHAAVVARGMGKPCVCGVRGVFVNEIEKYMKVGDLVIEQGQEITIDGTTGKIFVGGVELLPPALTDEFITLMEWVEEEKALSVRANAETVSDCNAAIKLGAEGIGLCRTEHMFFRSDKIALIREMIISPSIAQREDAIRRLLPIHKEDFKEIFRVMQGKPVNVRLLDPPLHEFLPQDESEKQDLAKRLQLPLIIVKDRLRALHEVNPMLGHRGCRLGITFPEIYEMQVEAIFEAAVELKKENIFIDLEIMLPLISDV